MNKIYITASIPYVNADPHLGHLMEFVEADFLSRWYKSKGAQVRLISGSDEHAIKIVRKAEEAGEPIEEYCVRHAEVFKSVSREALVEFDAFLRTSSPDHHKSSQELWNRCFEAGDIYEKEYSGMYCVGCEQFYSQNELNENGECFEHPGKPLEKVVEKNYFFRLSKYAQILKKLIESDELQIFPESRKNETLSFLSSDVQDISISRSKERSQGWGIPVPNDDSQVMYVWFDALNLYQTGAGFPNVQSEEYQGWWPADWHIIGKGILRFHTVYWPAMLLSAKLSLPKRVAVHGYLTSEGQKMSKTLGNVIPPQEMIERYGAEGFRYLLLGGVSTFEDTDVTRKRFDELYGSELANGLGNLVSRVTTMAQNLGLSISADQISEFKKSKAFYDLDQQVDSLIEKFELQKSVELVFRRISDLNKLMTERQPWKLTPQDQKDILIELSLELVGAATLLEPLFPKTATIILGCLTSSPIQKVPVLFPRLSKDL